MRKNFKDETGNQYGKLKVIEYLGYINTKNYWKCECECGVIKNITATYLRSKKCKSCGCARKGVKSDYIEAVYKKAYNQLVNNSKKYNTPKNKLISFVYWKKIVNSNCTYCGQPPYNKHYSYNRGHIKGSENNIYAIFGGVDRVCSDIGYIKKNCVPCCTFCNTMKTNATIESFKDIVDKIYFNFVNKKFTF